MEEMGAQQAWPHRVCDGGGDGGTASMATQSV